MMDNPDGGLTFNTLRAANDERRKSMRYRKCETEWTTAHWIQAIVGELGELANLLKKRDRGDFDRASAQKLARIQRKMANEMADILIYTDLLSSVLGIDLGDAVIHKFNVVSRRIKSPVHIAKDGSWGVRDRTRTQRGRRSTAQA